MSYIDFKSGYDKEPKTIICGYDTQAYEGCQRISTAISEHMIDKQTLVVDCYPGVDDAQLLLLFEKACNPALVINSKGIFLDNDVLNDKMAFFLTTDRVRGKMFYGDLMDFIDPDKLEKAKLQARNEKGKVLVYGFGAALITHGDALLYADLARWEIQKRYRKGMPNYNQQNHDEDVLRKYKRGFFVEWRIADRHKQTLIDTIDLYLDTNQVKNPKMITGEALRAGLTSLTTQPFRLVPYFDPGVWGGQWMKEVCQLPNEAPNYAWSFDGVPEENSLYLRFGDVLVEMPAMNLTLFQPRSFLGEKTYARFGAEFPIRFDFLDTMGGQNLSLQVHPLTDYMKNQFAMTYTQDESYYILDVEPNQGSVYLGVKNDVDPHQMIEDLKEAQKGENPFDADRYVNCFPAHKHDHFLIPAGTIHCSTAGCMVLEVSATPYIFTFKLWDWARVDLNGQPRPIHIDDGAKVLQFDRDTDYVKAHLINRFEPLYEGEDYTQIKTGLHELEFIETQVYTIQTNAIMKSNGEFAMLNLVEGKAAVIESTENRFSPFTVHYVETFILPANVGDVLIRPKNAGDIIKVLKAVVRF